MKFAGFVALLIGFAILPTRVRADCICGYPTPGFAGCVNIDQNTGKVTYSRNTQVVTCNSPGIHDNCIWCSTGVVAVPCCPHNPVYTAAQGGSCDIIQARLNEGPELESDAIYVQVLVKNCAGKLVPIIIHIRSNVVYRQRSS